MERKKAFDRGDPFSKHQFSSKEEVEEAEKACADSLTAAVEKKQGFDNKLTTAYARYNQPWAVWEM